jgi:proline dehydrogenase
MSLMRSALLAASESAWLRRHAPRLPFVRTAVTRFMPGETLEDALAAADGLRRDGIGTVLTELGENVTDAARADEAACHYADALAKIGARHLDCHISVKLTQLGLDVAPSRCQANLRSLVESAARHATFVWIDMEQHAYVDATLEAYRRVLAEFPNVGVCLQAYLYRTREDLASLIPLGGGVRLVKGAYREPANIAYPGKHDVDDNFLALATLMMAPGARVAGFRAVFGTHDLQLIRSIQGRMHAASLPRESVEFHLLFGIQRAAQIRLARERAHVRVLISYGERWFPWYMRRLAERPANVLFVAKSMISR